MSDSHAATHLCQLPDNIQDFVRKQNLGKAASSALLTHLRRELFHGAQAIILDDDELIEAYEHGMVVLCADGIERRVYPRFFQYSADYPEK